MDSHQDTGKIVWLPQKILTKEPICPCPLEGGGGGGELSPCVTAPSTDCCYTTCMLRSKYSVYVHIGCIVWGLNFCPAGSFNPFFPFAIVVVWTFEVLQAIFCILIVRFALVLYKIFLKPKQVYLNRSRLPLLTTFSARKYFLEQDKTDDWF